MWDELSEQIQTELEQLNLLLRTHALLLRKVAHTAPDTTDSMTKTTRARGAVISPALRARLKEYLQFRHLFRYAYTFDLRCEKMRLLVQGRQDVLRSLEAELDAFLRAGPGSRT